MKGWWLYANFYVELCYACIRHLKISYINEITIAFITNIINDYTGMDY